MKLRTFLILAFLLLGIFLLPETPVDPWKILNLKKLAVLLFALAFIQTFGNLAVHFFGNKAGAILTGFLGGLISSTATTVGLARRSRTEAGEGVTSKLTFLSATLAMLLEGMSIFLLGTSDRHLSLLAIFLGPIFCITLLLIRFSGQKGLAPVWIEVSQLKIAPILQLTAFIFIFLGISKILENWTGRDGIFALTLVMSLFEVHGSLIGNLQLHDAGAFDVSFLGALLSVSLAAACLSKLGLVFILGSSGLRRFVLKSTALLMLSLGGSFWIFRTLV